MASLRIEYRQLSNDHCLSTIFLPLDWSICKIIVIFYIQKRQNHPILQYCQNWCTLISKNFINEKILKKLILSMNKIRFILCPWFSLKHVLDILEIPLISTNFFQWTLWNKVGDVIESLVTGHWYTHPIFYTTHSPYICTPTGKRFFPIDIRVRVQFTLY